MSAAVETRGLKRVCVECGGRFYDMNKRPIACPTCSTEFTGELKVKGRRGRAEAATIDPLKAESQVSSAKAAEAANDEELEEEDDGVEVVSLDDAEPVPDPKTSEDDETPVVVLDDTDGLDGLEVPLDGLADAEGSDTEDDAEEE